MARAIREGRPHRAQGELAFHILDTMASIAESIETAPSSTSKVPPRKVPAARGLRDPPAANLSAEPTPHQPQLDDEKPEHHEKSPESPVDFAATAAMALSLSACGGGSSQASSDTITYWASDQGNSLDDTAAKLKPSLDRFTEKTGVKVQLEVISWTDLYNRILTAVTSGDGPDVLNIGNTWAVTLQETGAFEPVEGELLEAVGGKDRFLKTSWSTGGAEGKTPTSVPLYGLAYNMYYNTKMFKEAGIEKAPTTWDEFVADAKKLTKDTNGDGKPDQWGFTAAGASVSANSHQAFVRGLQNGGTLFDAEGKPTFDSDPQVEGVKQFVDLMATHKVMSPSDAELSQGSQKVDNVINGKAAMMFDQSPLKNFAARDFKDWGVAPIPMMTAGATGDAGTQSHVAGINLSVFKNSDNKANAIKLAAFLTSDEEQIALNKAYPRCPS